MIWVGVIINVPTCVIIIEGSNEHEMAQCTSRGFTFALYAMPGLMMMVSSC